MIEYVDHLHEHFLDPVVIAMARIGCRPCRATATRCGRSLERYRYPDEAEWRAL